MQVSKSSKFLSFFKEVVRALSGKEQEYTEGSIRKAIFLLAIPMIVEMLMESVFALVDIIYVSRVSVEAVATIGLTESVITLVYAVGIGLSMAVTAVVARRVGEGDLVRARQTAAQGILLGIIVSFLIGIVGFLYPKEILAAMGAEPAVIEQGYRYTQWLLTGNATILLLFLINAIFRGAGDASYAMWALVLSNGLNIILDPIFIFGWGFIPAYGVEGAGIATNIGRGTAVLFQLMILFFGWTRIKLTVQHFYLKAQIVKNLVRISLGGIGQFLIGTSSWVVLMRIMAVFGSEVLAGYTISIRVMMFTMMPAWGISNAAATLVGQNLGAKKSDRAETSVWLTGKYNAWFMGLVSVLYLFLARPILRLFSDVPAVVEAGALSLQIIAAGYIFYAYGMVLTQAFNGAGDTKTPTVINFFCFWLFQLPFAYLAAIYWDWGPLGVYLGITLAEVLIAIIAMVLFKKGKWKTMEV